MAESAPDAAGEPKSKRKQRQASIVQRVSVSAPFFRTLSSTAERDGNTRSNRFHSPSRHGKSPNLTVPSRYTKATFSRYFTMVRYGQKLAMARSMNARKVLDGQPGATPVIRTDGKNVTFRFELVGLQDQLRLALRCDPNGNVWAAIVSESERTDGERTDGR